MSSSALARPPLDPEVETVPAVNAGVPAGATRRDIAILATRTSPA
ncbi:hypothetical protein AB0L85_32380 [Streptomyces sp. NPDC052051]